MNKKTTALIISAVFIAIYGVFTIVTIVGKIKGNGTQTQTLTVKASPGTLATTPFRPVATASPQKSTEIIQIDYPATATPYAIVKRDDKPLPVLVTDTPPLPAQAPLALQTADVPDRTESDPGIAVDDSPYFQRVSDETPPEGFIIPKVKLIFNDGSKYGYYFQFIIENLDDYASSVPEYSFRAVCLNYDLLNQRQIMNANGTESGIFEVSRWLALNKVNYEQIKASGVIYVMPVKWYASIAEEKNFLLFPDMKLEYRFEIADGEYTMAFQKAFLLQDVRLK